MSNFAKQFLILLCLGASQLSALTVGLGSNYSGEMVSVTRTCHETHQCWFLLQANETNESINFLKYQWPNDDLTSLQFKVNSYEAQVTFRDGNVYFSDSEENTFESEIERPTDAKALCLSIDWGGQLTWLWV